MLVHNQASLLTGVLTAVPAYSYFKMMLQRLGTTVVPYYLDEEQGWAMEVEELRRALQAFKGVCNPVALYVINPGNPTGNELFRFHDGRYSSTPLFVPMNNVK